MSLTWILTLLLACAEPDAGDTSSCGAEDHPVTWDGYTRGFFLTYCAACHSSSATERYGAPEGVDFDTPQQVLDQAERVRARARGADHAVGGRSARRGPDAARRMAGLSTLTRGSHAA